MVRWLRRCVWLALPAEERLMIDMILAAYAEKLRRTCLIIALAVAVTALLVR